MRDADCIFCKLANGDIPVQTIYEDDFFKVILDASPATRGHALILPKEHCSDLFEIEENTLKALIVLAKRLGSEMKERLGCDGVNLVQNNGSVAGQTVFHFHLHVIPRYENDGQRIGWVPGSLSPEEGAELAARLRMD